MWFMLPLFTLACIAIGVASYKGYFRWWATDFMYVFYWGFSMLYMGIALLIPLGFLFFGKPPEPFGGIITSVFVVCCCLILASFLDTYLYVAEMVYRRQSRTKRMGTHQHCSC